MSINETEMMRKMQNYKEKIPFNGVSKIWKLSHFLIIIIVSFGLMRLR